MGGEARLSQLEPTLREVIKPGLEVVALRNGEAHLATGDETQRRRAFVTFLRCISALLQVDADEYWDPHQDLVRKTLDENTAETERLVAERIAAAHILFETHLGRLQGDHRDAVKTLTRNQRDARLDLLMALPVVCPVWEWPAIMKGETEQVGWDVNEGDDGPVSADPELAFYADSLECDACGLRLNSQDELLAADLDIAYPNDANEAVELRITELAEESAESLEG